MPDDSRVRIVTSHLPFFGINGLQATGWNRIVRVVDMKSQRRTDFPSLGRINTPKVTIALSMFWVLTNSNIDQAIVDYRGCNEVIARTPSTKFPLGFLRVAIKFPKQLCVSLAISSRRKTIGPAVTTRKNNLWHTTQHIVGRGRPLAVQNIDSRGTIGPKYFA